MNKKAIRDFLNKTPNTDFEDVMFVFPEVTLDEAARAVQRRNFAKALRRWLSRLLASGMFARLHKDLRQKT